MEIDITDFYNEADTKQFSNSIINTGLQNIGVITWKNAQRAKYNFLSVDNYKGFLDFMRQCGMEDATTLSLEDANALFVQYISSNIQTRKECYDSWDEYNESDFAGELFETDGKIYCQLDC